MTNPTEKLKTMKKQARDLDAALTSGTEISLSTAIDAVRVAPRVGTLVVEAENLFCRLTEEIDALDFVIERDRVLAEREKKAHEQIASAFRLLQGLTSCGGRWGLDPVLISKTAITKLQKAVAELEKIDGVDRCVCGGGMTPEDDNSGSFLLCDICDNTKPAKQ